MSLQETTAACRLRFNWWGISKATTKEQKQRAADTFHANRNLLSVNKKLIDSKNPAWQALNEVKAEAIEFWKTTTLPYVEDGIRLIARTRVEGFNRRMEEFRERLEQAAEQFEQSFQAIKADAEERLGELFNDADYPPSVADLFQMAWDFPNTNPPDYLAELNPRLYEQERQRMENRFAEAANLAQQAFANELASLVSHLAERLSEEDGQRKVFRNSAVTNLRDFFSKFRELSAAIDQGRNEALDQLVDQAQQLMIGVTPENLRDDEGLREDVRTGFQSIQSRLEGMMVTAPRWRWEAEPQQQPEPAA